MKKKRKRIAAVLMIAILASLVHMVGHMSETPQSRAAENKSELIWDEHISQATFIGKEDTTDVIVSDKVKEIDDNAFLNLPDLKWIVVWGNDRYASYYNCLYTKDYTELIYVPPHVGDESNVSFHHKLMVIRPLALSHAPQDLAEKATALQQKNWYLEQLSFQQSNYTFLLLFFVVSYF